MRAAVPSEDSAFEVSAISGIANRTE
jgi:hypothetical protein